MISNCHTAKLFNVNIKCPKNKNCIVKGELINMSHTHVVLINFITKLKILKMLKIYLPVLIKNCIY